MRKNVYSVQVRYLVTMGGMDLPARVSYHDILAKDSEEATTIAKARLEANEEDRVQVTEASAELLEDVIFIDSNGLRLSKLAGGVAVTDGYNTDYLAFDSDGSWRTIESAQFYFSGEMRDAISEYADSLCSSVACPA